MKLTSSVFSDGQTIPILFTGEGQNISPPLTWSDVPAGCKSLALLCEDPDAPGAISPFVHWIAYNISPRTVAFSEGVRGIDQGKNSFGESGYGGPMPPVGHGLHHYVFTLYALDTDLKLEPNMTKEEFLSSIDGHVISKAKLTGVYERKLSRRTA